MRINVKKWKKLSTKERNNLVELAILENLVKLRTLREKVLA